MVFKGRVFLGALAALTAGLTTACGTGEPPDPNQAAQGPGGGGGTVAISGAGATFPAPLFQRWFDTYNREVDSNVQVSYQSVGSGAGLEQYINGTVDFGASEAPMEGDRRESFLADYPYEPLQLPFVGGYVVFAYNLPTVEEELQFSRETYCGIIDGSIDNWNDPAIAGDNPGVQLPDQSITWVHRSDGSGTTFVFTNHLDTICSNWPSGAGTSVDWPVGIGGQGNEGVAAGISQNEGAIGYVSYAFAQLNELPVARIENQSGNYPDPLPANASLAFDGVEVPDDFNLTVPDPPHPDAYPISGLVWVLVYREYDDAQKWETMKEVFQWVLGPEGRAITEELFYVPMPDSLVDRIEQELDAVDAG